jgi:hypothetical protein
MINNNNNRGNSRRRRRVRRGVVPPSSSSTIYRGPARIPFSGAGMDQVVISFSNDFGSTSSAGGALTAVWNSDPTSAVDWADVANMYTKYRTLSFSLTFVPNQKFAVPPVAATLYAPIFTVTDNGNNTNLTGYAAAASYASCEFHTLNELWTHTVKMDTEELAQYNLIGGGPTSLMQVKTFCTGLTATTTYGQYVETYIVEFIGRQ